jgi:hypothetical protein
MHKCPGDTGKAHESAFFTLRAEFGATDARSVNRCEPRLEEAWAVRT